MIEAVGKPVSSEDTEILTLCFSRVMKIAIVSCSWCASFTVSA